MEHRLVLLQAAKQLLASSHLLPIFIIIEAPFQHLKDDRFHKLGDQCIPGTDCERAVCYTT